MFRYAPCVQAHPSTIAPPTTAPPAAEPADDLTRRVHLANVGKPITRRRGGLPHLVVIYGVMGGVVGLFLFLRLVSTTLNLPLPAAMLAAIVLGFAGAAFGGWWLLGWFRTNRKMPENIIRDDERYRVRCIAHPKQLEQLTRIGPFEDTPFEPQEFPGFLLLPPRAPMIVAWVLVSLVVGGAVLLFLGGTPHGLGIFVLYGVFAAGGLAVALLWPTRIRVVPGRLDLIRSLVFTPGKVERRSYTLRTSDVTVDLRRWNVQITGPSPQTSADLWIWPIPGRIELAHAILLGAVSTARPGPEE